MRAFIAIDLNEEIKKRICAFIRELDTGEKGIRWVKTRGMHLTLKFLGEVPEEKIERIKPLLENIAGNYPSFRLKLKGTGAFPPGAKFPRVMWIGIEMNETLENMQTRVENELQNLGISRENRKFHPHLTLARIKGRPDIEKVLESLASHAETDFGGMIVNRLTLFKSTLKPTGAEYTILSEFYLE
jgi:2'-5' RNA ligase